MNYRSIAIALVTLLCLAHPALADTITITASAIPTMTLNPSSDAISLDSSSTTLSAPGNVIFQTGTLTIGDSQISDQVIPFSFSEVITVNGVSHTVTIFGRDNVTTTADLITFSGAAPVNFGSYTFTLNSSTYNGTAIGQMPLSLSASVTAAQVPEPATLSLLATGVLGGAFVANRRTRRPPVCL